MIINYSNHFSNNWSKEQIEVAKQWGDIIDIPFANVPSDFDENAVMQLAQTEYEKIISYNPEVVMCQGEFTLTYNLINMLKNHNVKVVAACSERVTKEEVVETGETKKIAIFKFIRFREY